MLELVVAGLEVSPNPAAQPHHLADTTMDLDSWASLKSPVCAHPGVAERLIVEIIETVAT